MIFLIIFFYMMYIFRVLVNSIDFAFSFYCVSHICHYDMLFNVIIHMSLIFHFFWFQIFLFLVRLSHINFHFFWWILFLNCLFLSFAQFVLINLLILLMHLMIVLELIFSLILLICNAFLSFLSMQVIMLLILNHKWLFVLIKMM